MTPGFEILHLAALRATQFYIEAPSHGPAFTDFEVALRTAVAMTLSSDQRASDKGWLWFDNCFAELQRCGYAVAPDKSKV